MKFKLHSSAANSLERVNVERILRAKVAVMFGLTLPVSLRLFQLAFKSLML